MTAAAVRARVLAVVRASSPISANAVVVSVRARRGGVLAALRELGVRGRSDVPLQASWP